MTPKPVTNGLTRREIYLLAELRKIGSTPVLYHESERGMIEHCKPYTLPETASDSALVRCYARDVARFPALLTGLKRPDGTLYLPKAKRQNSIAPSSRQARSAA